MGISRQPKSWRVASDGLSSKETHAHLAVGGAAKRTNRSKTGEAAPRATGMRGGPRQKTGTCRALDTVTPTCEPQLPAARPVERFVERNGVRSRCWRRLEAPQLWSK